MIHVQVFDRIKTVANEDIVKDVQALFQFKLHNEGDFIVDLKNDQGSVTKGSLPADTKPDVVLVIDDDNLLKMFNRELTSAHHCTLLCLHDWQVDHQGRFVEGVSA